MKIEEICNDVRKWAENNRLYNNVEYPKDLGGMCAIVSCKLFSKLKENNITSKLALADFHCFVLKENVILDLTATQFGNIFPPVFIIDKDKLMEHIICNSIPRWFYGTYWDYHTLFDNIHDLKMKQIHTGWPDEQMYVLEDSTCRRDTM